MDIRVGAVAPVGPPAEKSAAPAGLIEARVLAVRPPRRQSQGPPQGRSDLRRNDSPPHDPPSARVLVLMVVDGSLIPPDAQTGGYRVSIRFAKR